MVNVLLRYLILLLLITASSIIYGQSVNNNDLTLDDVLIKIGSEKGYSLVFLASAIDKDQKVDSYNPSLSIEDILSDLLANTGLKFDIRGTQILIYKEHRISGYIEDKNSKERLLFANIYDPISKQGTTSNTYGYFSLLLSPISETLEISYVGYKNLVIEVSEYKNEIAILSLEPRNSFQEIVIEDGEKLIPFSRASLHKNQEINKENLSVYNSVGGERDLFQHLYQQSGVTSGPDGFGGLHVRGGNSDQNLILLDDAVVYHPNHSLGLISIFNPDLIKKASFKQAEFGSKDGSRLSSILAINLKDGNLKQWKKSASLSALAAQFTIEGPVLENKTSFLFSARRSIIDPIFRKISRKKKDKNFEDGYSDFNFYDINTKLSHTFNLKNRLYFTFYKGQDKYYDETSFFYEYPDYDLENDFSNIINWGNSIFSLRWNHIFSDQLFTNTSFNSSRYKYTSSSSLFYEDTEDDTIETLFQQDYFTSFLSRIRDVSIKTDLTFIPSTSHFVEFGVGYNNRGFKPGIISFDVNESQVFGDSYDEYQDTILPSFYTNNNLFVYAQESWKINKKVTFFYGGRYAYYHSFDPYEELDATYHMWQGNLLLSYVPNKKLRFNFSIDRMAQGFHLITSGDIGFPNDLWVPSTSIIKPQHSINTQLKLDWIQNSNLSLTLALYKRKLENILAFKEGGSLPSIYEVNTQFWEEEVSVGSGNAKGIELDIRYKNHKIESTIAYAYATAARQFEDINNGESFPFSFQRKHQVNLNLQYNINGNFKIYSQWVYGTGLPITLYKSDTYFQPLENLIPPPSNRLSEINGHELPDYHKLNIGIRKTWEYEKIQHSLDIGIQNAYARRNIYYEYVLEDEFELEERRIIQRTTLPLLPFINYKIAF